MLILLANVIHYCLIKYYVSSNLQSVVAALSCNTFVRAFVTLSPTASDAYFTPDTEEGRPPMPVRSLRVVSPLGWTMEVDRLP